MRTIEILSRYELIDWSVLFFGWQKGWVSKANIEDYAVFRLDIAYDDKYEMELCLLADSARLDEREISSLLQIFQIESKRDEFEIWRFAHLMELFHKEISEQAKVDELQLLYAEFDYPEDMRSCSIYKQDHLCPLIAMQNLIKLLADKLQIDL